MTTNNCPHCQLEMKIETIHKTKVEHCPSCDGLCLNKGELDSLTDEMEGSVEYSTITDHHNHQDGQPNISCPHCHTKLMRKVEFLAMAEVILDRCDSCGTMWLDKGELEKMNQIIHQLQDSHAEFPFWTKLKILAASIGAISL